MYIFIYIYITDIYIYIYILYMIYIKLAFILPDQFTVAGGLLTRSLEKIVINLNNLNSNLNNFSVIGVWRGYFFTSK